MNNITLLIIYGVFWESSMAKKNGDISSESDDDKFETSEIVEIISIINLDARRRLERLMEDKELERLINSKYDDLF